MVRYFSQLHCSCSPTLYIRQPQQRTCSVAFLPLRIFQVSRMLTNYPSPNFATAIGPVLGGALAQNPGWRWIFWLFAISSGVCLLLIFFFLPETSRFIVGNGSGKVSGLHRTLFSYLHPSRPLHLQDISGGSEDGPYDREDRLVRKPFRIPNPLASLKILCAMDTALIRMIYGVFYMNFSCPQASISTLFISIHGFSEINA